MKYNIAIIQFIILTLIIFLVDYIFINKHKLKNNETKKDKKPKSIGEIDYLVAKFKLDVNKLNKENMIIWISLINSFIISVVSSVIFLMPLPMIWNMIIAFILLFGLIYSLYEIYGRHLKKVEEKK